MESPLALLVEEAVAACDPRDVAALQQPSQQQQGGGGGGGDAAGAEGEALAQAVRARVEGLRLFQDVLQVLLQPGVQVRGIGGGGEGAGGRLSPGERAGEAGLRPPAAHPRPARRPPCAPPPAGRAVWQTPST